jgi:3-methyladenine DNA glycosylase AlkD
MDAVAEADRLEAALRAIGTADRAEHERAYLKSDLEFLGASVPAVREAVKSLWRQVRADASGDDVLSLVAALWAEPVHERRFAAVELLRCALPLLGPDDVPTIKRLIRESRTWALVDPLAIEVVGRLVLHHPSLTATLDRWVGDEDFWVRRSALLALLPGIRKQTPGHLDRLLRYADRLVAEREFFIRKAIGWTLREAGARDPSAVHGWLLCTPQASGVTFREAVKSLSVDQRAEVTQARRPA